MGRKLRVIPGFEEKLTGAEVFFSPVVCDGNVITSRGMGTAVPFGLAVARYFTDDATIETCKKPGLDTHKQVPEIVTFCSR